MADSPPPMPPQMAQRPQRRRVAVVLRPAKRIVTAQTTRNGLTAADGEPQDIDETREQP